MRSYGNEDVAWQRLLDVQREAENRRLLAAGGPPIKWSVGSWIAAGAWSFAHALGLMPRWWARDSAVPAVDGPCDEGEAATDAA